MREHEPDSSCDPLARLVGARAGLAAVVDEVRRLLGVPVNVLLQGESGTGKELVARALHEADPVRGPGPFVPVNCAALPETMVESELFGHCRGAFTGATADRDGAFVCAHGGTLFLDEIGELPLGLQPKLLRALQERACRPLGGRRERPVDVRVVSATNLDLPPRLASGAFRADLYYRLADYVIHLPPLRERRQDILPLAEHFLRTYAKAFGRPHVGGLSPAAARWLRAQDWATNNVRELSVALKRGVLKCDGPRLEVHHLAERPGPRPFGLRPRLETSERAEVTAALEQTRGNLAAAARLLGMKRSTLFDRMRRLGVARA
ncbi:MAG: sigma-54 dependent transcriptional regulator [Gemmatimonadota bacterium]